jgi:uncharacterized protein YciI
MDSGLHRRDEANPGGSHGEHINKMAATGKLVVAGPFSDDGDLRGVFIFHGVTMEEAKAMIDQDPAHNGGVPGCGTAPVVRGVGIARERAEVINTDLSPTALVP